MDLQVMSYPQQWKKS